LYKDEDITRMKKVLIFGSNGLLGQSLVQVLKADFTIIAASRGEKNKSILPDEDYHKLDMTHRAEMVDFIQAQRPDIIINAAAYTNVDGCESDKEACWDANVHAVENIIDGANGLETVLVHVSSDYVFDGMQGQYSEEDELSPLGSYARSKMAAENIVTHAPMDHIIARTQVLYGYAKDVRLNFATWVISRLSVGKNIRVVIDQIGNPTYVDDLSESILRLLQNREYGLFHISGPETLSRYDFALIIAEVFDLNPDLIDKIITADLEQAAPRPLNSSFIIDKLVNRINWKPGDVRQGLLKLKSKLQKV